MLIAHDKTMSKRILYFVNCHYLISHTHTHTKNFPFLQISHKYRDNLLKEFNN